MQEDQSFKDLEKLMAEAEALIQQIDADAIENMNEEHRLKVEKCANDLKQIQDGLKDDKEKKEGSDFGHGAKGMHEAIQEITKAMGEMAKYLT